MSELLYFEDLPAGRVFHSARTITMERDRIMGFAREFDPHPGHTSEETARESSFGELVASGWHTAASVCRLIVETTPIAGGGMGGGVELRWKRPVRPGDTLRITMEVLTARESTTRPGWGIATIRTTAYNQHDEPVLVMNSTNFLPRRPG